MDTVVAALVAGLLSAVAVAVAMWKAEWLHDREGRLAPNGYHLGFVVAGGVVGGAYGAVEGVLGGLAVLAALLNVVLGMLLAWGVSGGDGEQPNPVVGLLGVGIFVSVIAAFGTTLSALGSPSTRSLVVLALPSLLTLLALVAGPDRRGWWRGALGSAALLAVPLGLVALSG